MSWSLRKSMSLRTYVAQKTPVIQEFDGTNTSGLRPPLLCIHTNAPSVRSDSSASRSLFSLYRPGKQMLRHFCLQPNKQQNSQCSFKSSGSEAVYVLGMVSSFSSASCSVSLSSNLMSLNHDGSECPSSELTLSLSGDGVSENSVLW